MVKTGVLALQGDFEKHLHALARLSAESVEVRTPKDLDSCAALIIPGGESTTLRKMMKSCGLWDALTERRSDDFPVFGTCAGLILLSEKLLDGKDDEDTLRFLNLTVRRNAYGRQRESFVAPIEVHLNGRAESAEAVFIRAPAIEAVSNPARVLATLDNHPILVQQGASLGAAFHPELTGETLVHSHFLKLIRERWS